MDQAPRLRAPDSTASLLREGYGFIPSRRRRFHTDVFRGRLLLEPVIFMGGAEAAELFYDESRFRRSDAVPRFVLDTLFGRGGVQGLDDEAHRRRKAMFMSLMTHSALERFVETLRREWEEAAARWMTSKRVVLMQEAEHVLCASACAFSGWRWVGGASRPSRASAPR